MTDKTEKRKALLTPPFRVSFPSVFEKSSYNNGTPRYSLTALFFPKQWKEGDGNKEKWSAILAALNTVSIEAFKKPMKDLDKGIYKLPFHKGDSKDYEGYGDPEMRYCSMANTKKRPQILDRDGVTFITTENSDEFYAGCWARASVRPYAFNNIGKGLALGLGNLQKLKDDKSFEGFTSAEDDFGGEASEFGDGSEDDFSAGDQTEEVDPTA
jgi:hypothetical protein